MGQVIPFLAIVLVVSIASIPDALEKRATEERKNK